MTDEEIGNMALLGLWVSVVVVSAGFLFRTVWGLVKAQNE